MTNNLDKTRGLYDKFHVIRKDGSSAEGGKHEACAYFVLDLTHDSYSVDALEAYAWACKKEYPILASDLESIVDRLRR